VVEFMSTTIFMATFSLRNTVDVDVSKHVMRFNQWTHKKTHFAETIKDMNKKKKYKDWNKT
jgi:hypothetical protein